MTIASLIDKTDNLELVRGAVATILAAETVSQQALATAASEDPRLWTWRVYEERDRPWSAFLAAAQAGTAQLDVPPIVNVSIDSATVDRSASDPVKHQVYDARILVDCYGFGLSEADGGGGHVPGDKRAREEAQRVARLVRNVLMAGDYTYLGLRGVVSRRMVSTIQAHSAADPSSGMNVATVQLVLDVRLAETTLQVEAVNIAGIDVDVERLSDGEVLASASWDAS